MLQLSKGQNALILSKDGSQGAKKIKVGLGWDVNTDSSMKFDFDLDVSVFILDKNGKLSGTKDVVFYNNICSVVGGESKSVLQGKTPDEIMEIVKDYAAKGSYCMHLGDNRTGVGAGDDETIMTNLDKVPADKDKMLYVVSIDEAKTRGQFFGMVENAYIHIVDDQGVELCRYNLTDKFDVEAGVIIGEMYRSDEGDWKFKATGKGFTGDLNSVYAKYI